MFDDGNDNGHDNGHDNGNSNSNGYDNGYDNGEALDRNLPGRRLLGHFGDTPR